MRVAGIAIAGLGLLLLAASGAWAQGWHKTAPDLASSGRLFERWKEAGRVPAYKLKHEDAEAIVSCLKSLK